MITKYKSLLLPHILASIPSHFPQNTTKDGMTYLLKQLKTDRKKFKLALNYLLTFTEKNMDLKQR